MAAVAKKVVGIEWHKTAGPARELVNELFGKPVKEFVQTVIKHARDAGALNDKGYGRWYQLGITARLMSVAKELKHELLALVSLVVTECKLLEGQLGVEHSDVINYANSGAVGYVGMTRQQAYIEFVREIYANAFYERTPTTPADIDLMTTQLLNIAQRCSTTQQAQDIRGKFHGLKARIFTLYRLILSHGTFPTASFEFEAMIVSIINALNPETRARVVRQKYTVSQNETPGFHIMLACGVPLAVHAYDYTGSCAEIEVKLDCSEQYDMDLVCSGQFNVIRPTESRGFSVYDDDDEDNVRAAVSRIEEILSIESELPGNKFRI